MPQHVLQRVLMLALFCPTLLGTPYAYAQETEEEDKKLAKTKASRDATLKGKSNTRVSKKELERRQPRSAPDALKYEPGVFVQQTAHSQGSAFIRGRTGQQTVLMFDEVRLNNSLFRQGPNQYFFTIDSQTIHHIDITRGSASTRYGTDAIAGAVNASPLEPTLGGARWSMTPRLSGRYASADNMLGGRLELEAQWAGKIGILAGIGGRQVGQLESGGPITGQDNPVEVPRFESDGRTQRGTGFDELTADARVVIPLSKRLLWTVAYYDYRQFDAPRTDQCPPPEAPFDECLKYDEQFRSLLYTSLDGRWNDWMRRTRLILSVQRQHERRTLDRPGSSTINGGRDDVTSYGLMWRSQSKRFNITENQQLSWSWGADLYRDRVESVAWLIFEDNNITLKRSRGQYVDGSTYLTMGAWTELEWRLFQKVVLRAGARQSHIKANSPADLESDTKPVNASWSPAVGNIGAEWWVNTWMTLLANVDQGFRAPNLDDMTSRQRTGPGYQLENANLQPENGVTMEVGARWSLPWIDLDIWGYRATLADAITRATKQASDCPQNTPDCNNSRTYLQLVNVPGDAVILGAEGGLKLRLPHDFQTRATISYATGDGPNPDSTRSERVPLSRIPPLNGTLEGLWSRKGFYVGSGIRWSSAQTKLSNSDISDARIPDGGTPGFVVMDIRAGYRIKDRFKANLVFENITDEAYRYHGSSVNGPARGISLTLGGQL